MLRTCGAAFAPVTQAYFAQHDFERMGNRQRIPWGSKMDYCENENGKNPKRGVIYQILEFFIIRLQVESSTALIPETFNTLQLLIIITKLKNHREGSDYHDQNVLKILIRNSHSLLKFIPK